MYNIYNIIILYFYINYIYIIPVFKTILDSIVWFLLKKQTKVGIKKPTVSSPPRRHYYLLRFLSLIFSRDQLVEKEMVTHSSILTWRIPGTEELDGLPSIGLHRVGHNWSDLAAATAETIWKCSSLGKIRFNLR